LINSFSYAVRLGETAAIDPAQCVTNLKPRQANRQPHKILRACTSKHCHMPARFQHTHTFLPHCRWWNEAIPVSAHEPTPLSRNRYGVTGNPCFEHVRDLLWLCVA